MKEYAKQTIREIKSSNQKFKHDNITGTHCPDCGKLMLKVNGKRGTMLVCQDRECGHRKTVAKQTNAGTAKLNHSKDLKDKIWDERLEQWFDGKDDPNLTVLEIEPSEIRLMNEGESTPVTLDM